MKNDSKLENYLAKQQLKEKRAELAKKDNRLFPMIAAGALALAVLSQLAYVGFGPGSSDAQSAAEPEVTQAEEAQTAEPEPTQTNDSAVPDPAISEDRVWSGAMNLNDEPLSFELYGDLAPQAVANFVALTQDGFYENVSCHRLVTAGIYVLQCGDPDGNGTGGPGYDWGPIENAPADDLYTEGTIAMARVGGNDYSMGSQFFIVYEDSTIPSDSVGGYTIFGKVTSGLESVKAIAEAGTVLGGSDGQPAEPVLMTSVSVE